MGDSLFWPDIMMANGPAAKRVDITKRIGWHSVARSDGFYANWASPVRALSWLALGYGLRAQP